MDRIDEFVAELEALEKSMGFIFGLAAVVIPRI